MPDYNETTLTGAAWQRCHEVSIANTRNTLPVIQFYEERVIVLDDGAEIRQPLGALTVPFDPARLIPLRDPLTGEATGDEMTYGQAYAVLYSAYLEAALARDADLPPPADLSTDNE
jgi:hypothetical protein